MSGRNVNRKNVESIASRVARLIIPVGRMRQCHHPPPRCHYLSPGSFAVNLTLLIDAVVASSEEPFGTSAVNNSLFAPGLISSLLQAFTRQTSYASSLAINHLGLLHHPTEQGGKNIKVFALPVENNTAKKKKRGNDQEGNKAERRCTYPLINSNLL